jgi:hypothetical protein
VKDGILSSGRLNDKQFRSGRSLSPNTTIESSTAVVSTIPDPALKSVVLTSSSPHLDSNDVDSLDQGVELSQTIARYQSDLVQKDELITALINELEQAVEQLDRFQRTGSNRSHSAPSPAQNSYSNIASEPQSPLMDDLRRMANDWEQAQPASALERIESQLAAMHDLVLNLQNNGRAGAHDRVSPEVLDFEDRVRRLNAETAADEQQDQDTANMTLDESSPSWEAIKRQIFGGSEPAIENSNQEADDSELLRLLNETPAPTEINFDVAGIDELKQAISERDAYIIQLNRLFRTRNSFSLPADWSVLANVPNEMQVRVESLIERLDVQVRLGEVEMSLERARLARERSQIQSEREMIEKHMRRLGLKSLADLDNISAATGSAGDRRWMRFLGPNTK